ncbi:MAG: YaeQ family protein, partial [Rheinheimera sp.]
QLWCQVDLPNEKQLMRASHQADQVLLVPDCAELRRAQSMIKGFSNVRLFCLSNEQLIEFCSMLKRHMQLAVWRDESQLIVTDGQLQLEIQVAPLAESCFHASKDMGLTFTAKH